MGIDLAAGPDVTITDPAGNRLTGGEPPIDQVYRIDGANPVITAVTRRTPADDPNDGPRPTNADELEFLVRFSEPVTGVGTPDFRTTGTSAMIVGVTPFGPSLQIASRTYAASHVLDVAGGDLENLNGAVGIAFNNRNVILDDGADEVAETFTVTVVSSSGNPAGSLTIGDPASVETTITDGDVPVATITGPASVGEDAGSLLDKVLLRRRFIIETLFDRLKSQMGLEHTRHRSPVNAFVHILSCLAACTPGKTRISMRGVQ